MNIGECIHSDILRNIMLLLSIKDLYNFALINKSAYDIYQSKYFWSAKFINIPFYIERPPGRLSSFEYRYCRTCLTTTDKLIDILYKRRLEITITSLGDLHLLNINDIDILKYFYTIFVGGSRLSSYIYISYDTNAYPMFNDDPPEYYLLSTGWGDCYMKDVNSVENIIYLAVYYNKEFQNRR